MKVNAHLSLVALLVIAADLGQLNSNVKRRADFWYFASISKITDYNFFEEFVVIFSLRNQHASRKFIAISIAAFYNQLSFFFVWVQGVLCAIVHQPA